MDQFLKSLADAGKGRVAFLAFFAVLVIGGHLLLNGLDFLKFCGYVAIMVLAWLALRYGLLKAQSQERLRMMREGAKYEASRQLEKHATKEELAGLITSRAEGVSND